MGLRTFLSDPRQVLSEAPMFDSDEQIGHIKTVTCEPRPFPEMSKLWEQTLSDPESHFS